MYGTVIISEELVVVDVNVEVVVGVGVNVVVGVGVDVVVVCSENKWSRCMSLMKATPIRLLYIRFLLVLTSNVYNPCLCNV